MNIGSGVTQAEERWKHNGLSDLDNLNDKMKEHLEWSYSKLLCFVGISSNTNVDQALHGCVS